jgi:hypothetical protein
LILKICLITPGHLASNPRLVKEAMALTGEGIQVHLIFTRYTKYLRDHDAAILAANPTWTYDCRDWTTDSIRSRLNRLFSGLWQRLSKKTERQINRHYRWQLRKALQQNADLYIAHNLGALAPAVLAAEKTSGRSGFDLEDFYRYQLTDDEEDPRVWQVTAVEDNYIPRVDYLTGAGEPISQRYRQLFNCAVTSIQNVFPKTPATLFNSLQAPVLRICWFSQTIGSNRGLEDAIRAIGLSGVPLEFHLLGEVTPDYRNSLEQLQQASAPACRLFFHPTMAPEAIFPFCAQFDIGLAAEPGFSWNNRLALSNKLFTYIQCGLAVLVSATPAQEAFLQEYPEVGKLYHDIEEHAAKLAAYHADRQLLAATRQAAFELGQSRLNWEQESPKFIHVIRATLNTPCLKGY